MHAVLCTCRLKSTFIYEFYIDLNYSGQNSVQCSVIQLARSCLCTAQISCCSYLCSKSTAHILHISMGLASAGRGAVGAYAAGGRAPRLRHRAVHHLPASVGGRLSAGAAEQASCEPATLWGTEAASAKKSAGAPGQGLLATLVEIRPSAPARVGGCRSSQRVGLPPRVRLRQQRRQANPAADFADLRWDFGPMGGRFVGGQGPPVQAVLDLQSCNKGAIPTAPRAVSHPEPPRSHTGVRATG